MKWHLLWAVCGWLAVSSSVLADAPALYQQHCASCHGADRLGVDDYGQSFRSFAGSVTWSQGIRRYR